MSRAELRHVSLEVRDLERTRIFHDRFLGRLGFRRFVHEATYLGYTDGTLTVWLLRENRPRIARRPPTGEEEVVAEHLAFWVPSEAEVRAIQADLERQEIYPLFRAQEHPEFRPGYVSAVWVDPDESVLEVYTTAAARKTPAHRRSARPRAPRARRPKRR